MHWLKRTYEWLDFRLKLGGPITEAVTHPIPRNTASWWYVFGSASFVLLLLQIATGILLAIVYVPSAGEAWNSLQVLNHQLPLGWFLRAMHGWGSNFMVAVVLIHMAQVFLFGAYKFPRELTWILGVFLLLMTLGMAFTGQVMRFDQDAYWGLGIGASIVARVPFIGGPLVDLLLGGPIIAGPTLTRFFALHVFVIPGLMLAFAGLHVWMVIALGINDWPMPGRIVRRSTYIQEYHELTKKDGEPFVPGGLWRDMIFSAAILLAVAACAMILGPFGPTGFPDPTIIQTVPKPDFFFLWIYTILSFLPENLETPFILIAPILGIGFLLALPFFAGEGGKELAPQADRRALRHLPCGGLCRVPALGNLHPLESTNAGMERRHGPRTLCAQSHPLGQARPDRFSGQAVPQLPHARRRGWRARSGARRSRNQVDLRPARAPGAAGRRQYARVREESLPGRSNRTGQLPRNFASRGPTSRARCLATIPQHRRTRPRAVGPRPT